MFGEFLEFLGIPCGFSFFNIVQVEKIYIQNINRSESGTWTSWTI